jgi:DHA1 family bicyclomycin/chloramphenicol resistance-like MFS transporter
MAASAAAAYQPPWVLTIGLTLSAAAAVTLLAMTVVGWTQPAVIVTLLMAVALAFGMTMPNIMNATMQPLPDIAGAVGAAAGSIQVTAGAVSSGLVAAFFDGWSALSMAAVMATCSVLALIAYCLLARPAERRIHSHAVEAPAAIEMTMHS